MKEFLKGLRGKITQKSFWLALSSAVILLLQTVGIKLDVPVVSEFINVACTIFILLGVITDSKKVEVDTEEKNDEECYKIRKNE